MEILEFKKLFNDRSGINIYDDYILFDNYNLYSHNNNVDIDLETFENALEYIIDKKTIKQIIEEASSFDVEVNGGRGARSSKGSKLFSLQGKKGKKKLTSFTNGNGNSFPAYLNVKTGQRFKSQEKTIKTFANLMDKQTIEYSASIDEGGFATKYNKGNEGSTAFLSVKNGVLIHNHPVYDKKGRVVAWNSFSGQDLKAISMDKNTKGIVATANGNKSMYKFTKTKSFKGQDFIKAMSEAKMESSNYDKEVDKWLRNNQKKYGYKYSRRKYK